MINLFCGYDQREAIGWHVFVASVLARTSQPVAIHRLDSCGLHQGSNAFSLSRFLVPYMMGFKGRAIFCDGADMLMLSDIAELDSLFDLTMAVQVVKHPKYSTKHKMKYIGTSMQCPNMDYPRKNWASVMLINCEHKVWSGVDPQTLEGCSIKSTLQFDCVPDEVIGALPDEWNRIVDEGHPVEGAKVIHFTAGLPCFPHYAKTPGAAPWFAERDKMLEIA